MLAEAAAVLALAAGPGDVAHRVAVSIARDGTRPAGSAAERRAHGRMARRFRAAGLAVRVQRFSTPRGRSRNVIGAWPGRARCLRVVMAHTDSMPAGPGAEDNASGLGALAALAPRLEGLAPRCEVWLVATGAEERLYTGSPDHLGALALARIVPRSRLRYALSLDEVGSSGRFRLRSPVGAPRRGVERELLRAARRADVRAGLAARQRHGQLRPPRDRAGRDARSQARRGGQPLPPPRLRPAGAAEARGVPPRAAGRRGRPRALSVAPANVNGAGWGSEGAGPSGAPTLWGL